MIFFTYYIMCWIRIETHVLLYRLKQVFLMLSINSYLIFYNKGFVETQVSLHNILKAVIGNFIKTANTVVLISRNLIVKGQTLLHVIIFIQKYISTHFLHRDKNFTESLKLLTEF